MVRRIKEDGDYEIMANLITRETLISDDILGATIGEGKDREEDSEDKSHFINKI